MQSFNKGSLSWAVYFGYKEAQDTTRLQKPLTIAEQRHKLQDSVMCHKEYSGFPRSAHSYVPRV